MKHKRGEIIAKHLDEIFLDGYNPKNIVCREITFFKLNFLGGKKILQEKGGEM